MNTKLQKPTQIKDHRATAIHGTMADGSTHVVGIGNLRVVLMNDDGSWFAQGLEIDYAAEGISLEDVKEKFAEGLCATIEEHLKLFGTIEKMLKPAPAEIWRNVLLSGKEFRKYSGVSVHKMLPFENVEYFAPPAAA